MRGNTVACMSDLFSSTNGAYQTSPMLEVDSGSEVCLEAYSAGTKIQKHLQDDSTIVSLTAKHLINFQDCQELGMGRGSDDR